ncbi:MAG: hypothetical protein R2850_06260 [Bacteroidia bacterium]
MFCLLTGLGLLGQQQKNSSHSGWEARLNVGAGSFSSSGIPESRNQINFRQLNLNNTPEYKQESRNVGFCYELALYKNVGSRIRIGASVNFFRDDDEYLGTSDLTNNIESIRADSLQRMTIYNLQSYANAGFVIEYDVFSAINGRHRLSLGLATGPCINRTPDRTEFDQFADNQFIEAPVSGSNDTWYITSTKFHSGWYLMPSAVYGLKIRRNHFLNFSFSIAQHWLSSSYSTQILTENSSGSANQKQYSVFSTQLKLGYSFTF